MTTPLVLTTTRPDPSAMLQAITQQWGGQSDVWIFAYASLIWRPEFDFSEQRFAALHGYHRALKMWSHNHRGTPEQPGLVFGLLSGGSCKGVVFRLPQARVADTLLALWAREMPNGIYDPKWLRCRTAEGDVKALAFTLSRRSANHTGVLEQDHYRQIFALASGCYGSTRDYAQRTYDKLRSLGIHDEALEKLLQLVALKPD